MGWLDDVVASVAPNWALRRTLARQALARVRAYDAGQRLARHDGWRRPATSGRAEAQAGAAGVRNAVRDLLRNNGYAQRAHRTLVRATIGTGIIGSPLTAAGAAAPRATTDAWNRWVESCDWDGHHDLYGLQLLAARTVYESGEAILRIRRAPYSAGDPVVPIRLQVLEPDYLDDMRNATLNGGGYIDRGIEYDAAGRKVALWLLPQHPGDTAAWRRRADSQRVPIGEAIQIFDMLRPQQDRGVSIFAGAVMPLKDLAAYFEAEAVRKRIEACLSAFVTRADPGADFPLGLQADSQPTEGERTVKMAPGLIHDLPAGTSVTTLAPHGSPDIAPFADQMLFLAAAAGGVMFEHLTGNMKYVNYSSYRVGSYDFAGFIEQQQWLMWMSRFCRPVARAWGEAALAANLLSRAPQLRWSPPPAITSPDPLKDAMADQLALRLGIMAPSEIAERRGWTHQELLDRIAGDLAAHDAAGLMFDGDPRKNMKGTNIATEDRDTPPPGADRA